MKRILLTLILSCITISAEPTLNKELLSRAELQKLLGITSFRMQFPNDYGDYYNLRVELYKGDDLIITLGGRTRIADDRNLAIAIQDTKEGFSVAEIASNTGSYCIIIPNIYLKGFSGPGIYTMARTPMKKIEGRRLLLYERLYYKAEFEADGQSFSTSNPKNKKIGRCIVFLEPKSVNDKNKKK